MGFWTIAAIAASIISGGASYVQAKKAAKIAKRAAKQGQGLLINSDGTNNFIPVIYGTRRIAGTRVFIATGDDPTGDLNGILYLVYVLCEGEVDAITDILIDDLPTSDSRFAYTNSVLINTFLGTDVQTADADFIAAGIGWTSEHRLKGLAYITVRLKWNSNAFSSIPNITALVRGKKVYDTRTATTAYSTNPALCIRDYLTNNRYGKGLAAGSIDDSSISAAATFYDNTVTFWPTGTVGKLFEFNAVIDTEQKILDNLKDMLFCCRGFLPYTNGVYQLIPDKSASSVFAFTTSNIVSGISIRGESKEDKYNKVILTFTDPNNNFQENTAIFPDASDTSYLVADNNVELVGDFELPCITNYYAARDLARVFLLRSRNALRCAFNANSDALNLSVGDVVTVTHPTPGFSAKPFQVEELTINYDGTCRVSLLEYDSSIYTYDPASEQLSFPDTDLPNPYSVVAPTSFVVTETTYLSSDGTLVPEIKITWTASADAFVDYYEFEFKKSADTAYQSAIAYQPVYVNTFGVIGTTYNIRVRAVNSLGVTSSFLTSTYTVVGDTTAPATPTGLTITGSYNEAILKWNLATEKDYKETLIFSNTVNSIPATPTLIITGNTVTVFDLAKSTTFYVWLKHVDFSGNISAASTVVTFSTTSGLTDVALADNAVTTPKINALAVTTGKVAANAITNAKLDANAVAANVFAAGVQPLGIFATVPLTRTVDTIFVTSTAKLYRWNGTAYVKSVDNDDIVSIVADKITAGTINAAITTTNILQLSTNGKIYTAGKTSAASTTAGVFLGHDGGSNYDFAVGDGTKSIVWDGSAGTFTITNVNISTNGQLISTGSAASSGGNGAVVGAPTNTGVLGVIGVATSTHTVPALGGYSTSTNTAAVGMLGQTTVLGVAAVSGIAGAYASGGLAGKFSGNVTVGEDPTNTGIYNLIIKEGVVGSRLDNQFQIYGQLSADSDTTLGLVLEQGVEAGTGSFAGLSQLRIHINGVAYKLPLEAY